MVIFARFLSLAEIITQSVKCWAILGSLSEPVSVKQPDKQEAWMTYTLNEMGRSGRAGFLEVSSRVFRYN
jgi:hypothetical protein